MTRRRPAIRAGTTSGEGDDRRGPEGSPPARPAEDWRWLELGRVLRGIADRHGAEILRRARSERDAAAARRLAPRRGRGGPDRG
ncbi:MAG TPA: hypothetical protein VG370_20505 [Chloroflexota bacterium]|jgi:hypothetical protein|nr:hypothetical protein [Chloroflexota bacterium]